MTQFGNAPLSELARKRTRVVLPKSLYIVVSSLLDRVMVMRKLGWEGYRSLFSLGVIGQNSLVKIYPNSPPFEFRASSPDVGTVVQSLIRREWGRYRAQSPATILDAGAYIGDTAVFFLNEYPRASVIAIEPNPINLDILRRNLDGYGSRVKIVPVGLWSEDTYLHISGQYTGATLVPQSENVDQYTGETPAISCRSIQSLQQQLQVEKFDIVKLDIEGAESEVILQNSDWLHSTQMLIAEFHGEGIKSSCTQYLTKNGFRYFPYRSVHYFMR